MEFRIFQEIFGGGGQGGGKIFPWKSIPWLHFWEKTSLEKEKVVLKRNQSTMTTIHDDNVYLI